MVEHVHGQHQWLGHCSGWTRRATRRRAWRATRGGYGGPPGGSGWHGGPPGGPGWHGGPPPAGPHGGYGGYPHGGYGGIRMEGMEAMDGMAWASELHSTHFCTGLGITQGPTTILPTTTLQAPYPCQPRRRYTLNAGRKRNPRPRHRLPGITVPTRKAITPMWRIARVAGRPWPRVPPPRLAKGGRDAISPPPPGYTRQWRSGPGWHLPAMWPVGTSSTACGACESC